MEIPTVQFCPGSFHFFPLRAQIPSPFLSTLFSNTLSLRSSLSATE
jgi:hypothetical protein